MARLSSATLETVNLGIRIEELASNAYCHASRIENGLHARLRGDAIGVSDEAGRQARAEVETAVAALLRAMALLNIQPEV